MQKIYHYTTDEHLADIQRSGSLIPSSIGILPGEKGAVWFTCNQNWDATANKDLIGEQGDRLLRIEIPFDKFHLCDLIPVRLTFPENVAPLDWARYKSTCGAPSKVAKALYDIALRKCVSPREWRCTYESVAIVDAISIEFWNGDAWTVDEPILPEVDQADVNAFVDAQVKAGRYAVVSST